MGLCAGRLIPGYDCPYHATYWNSTFSSGNRHLTNQATICIFESDIGAPITRRTDTSFMQATKGSKLVVRQISTMGNYEYLWDYVSIFSPLPFLPLPFGRDPTLISMCDRSPSGSMAPSRSMRAPLATSKRPTTGRRMRGSGARASRRASRAHYTHMS